MEHVEGHDRLDKFVPIVKSNVRTRTIRTIRQNL